MYWVKYRCIARVIGSPRTKINKLKPIGLDYIYICICRLVDWNKKLHLLLLIPTKISNMIATKYYSSSYSFVLLFRRSIFAKEANRHDPGLKLSEHEPAGDWRINYDLGSS
jgi:hypothetical protein